MQAASHDGEYSSHCCRVHFRFMVKLWFLTFTVRFYTLPEKKNEEMHSAARIYGWTSSLLLIGGTQQTATGSKHFHTWRGAPTWGNFLCSPPKFERDSPCSNISWCSWHFFMQERSFPAWIHSVSCRAPLSFSRMLPLLTDWPWLHIWFQFWSRSHTQVDRFRMMRTIREIWQTIQTAGLSTTCVVPPPPQLKYPYSIARVSMSSASTGVSLCVGSRKATGDQQSQMLFVQSKMPS